MSKNSRKDEQKPKVHKALDGFNIEVNSFGEIVSTHKIDELKEFLDKHVVDKKLKDREDLDVKRE